MVFNFGTAYLIVAIIALILILIVIFFVKSNKKRNLSVLNTAAFLCVALGIILGTDRFWGYLLLGVGMILAIIDVYLKLKR